MNSQISAAKLESIDHFLKICDGNERQFALLVQPEDALTLSIKYNYSEQRKLDDAKVRRYASFIKNKTFRARTSIDFCVINGEPHLVNGQHTLRAIHQSKEPFEIAFNLHHVKTLKDIEEIYSTFDPGGSVRTLNQVFGNIQNELGLTKKHETNALGVAVKYIHSGFNPGNPEDPSKEFDLLNHELVKNLMREWGGEARQFFSAISSGGVAAKVMLRGAIVAVGLITYRYQPEKAEQFWREAAMDDGLKKKDPRKTFFNWCQQNTTAGKQQIQHRAAIACWNAFFEGKELSGVYTSPERSAIILGTPIDLRRSEG